MADVKSGSEDAIITPVANDTDVDDGALLSYSLNAPVAGLTLNGDGTYSFDAGNAAYQHLAQGATGTVVANYTVTDEHGATSTSTLTITLTGTNDTPVAVADSNAGNEDATITGSVANDTDVDDGALLSYSLNAPVAGLTLNGDGSYSFDASNAAYQHLAQGATQVVTANYTVTDEHGASSTSTLTITLTGTNDAPVAVADTKSGSEDATITGTVANDNDIDDGAILTYSLNAPVAGLTLNGDGSYSFDASNAAYQHLAQGATGTVVANYTVTDQHGATSTSTLTITLTGTNDAPVAVADTKSGSEDATITGTVANDNDIDDGAILTYSLNAPVAGLTLNGDGSYSFDASNAAYQHLVQGATQVVTANYTVTDEHGASSTSTLTITLTGTNDAPVAVADVKSGSEDAIITGSVANDTDVDDGALLSYSLNAPVAGLTLNGDGTYSFDAGNAAYQHLAQGATGTVVANYTVTDEHGATSTSTLTITLTGTNDAPVAVADAFGVSEGAFSSTVNLLTAGVADSDVDGDALQIVAISDMRDTGTGSVATSAVSPASAGVITTDYGAEITLQSNGQLFYNLTSATALFNQLAAGETAVDTFTYTIGDGQGGADTATVSVTITGVNDAIAAVNDTISLVEGVGGAASSNLLNGAAPGSILDNDQDVDANDTRTVVGVTGSATATAMSTAGGYAITLGSSGVVINLLADGTYTVAVPDSLAGGQTVSGSFQYSVQDGGGAVSIATVNVTVDGTNDTPVVASALVDQTGAEDTAFSFTVPVGTFSDVDNATLAYSLGSGSPSWLTISGNVISGTPPLDFNGTVSVEVIATDVGGLTATDTFDLAIGAVNDAPTGAVLTSSAVDEFAAAAAVVGALSGVDPDDTTGFSYTLLDDASGRFILVDGELRVADGLLLDFEQAAAHSVTVRVTDAGGLSVDQVLSVTVNDINPENVAGSGADDTFVGGTGSDMLSGMDGDDTLEGGAGGDTLDGGAHVNGDTVRYTGSDAGVTVNIGTNTASGGHATDDIIANFENVTGSAHNDVITGTNANNTLRGGSGGRDALHGLAGADILFGGNEVGAGDELHGGGDNDDLYGEGGNDNLFGEAGADRLYGGEGNDFLYADGLDTVLDGGSGSDFVHALASTTGLTLDMGAGSIEGVYGSNSAVDTLDATTAASGVTIWGLGGADFLTGSAYNDYVYFDQFDLATGSINGGAGFDWLLNRSATALTFDMNAHAAEGYYGNGFADTVTAASSTVGVTIYGNGGGDVITGSTFTDYIYFESDTASIDGGGGYDYAIYNPVSGAPVVDVALTWRRRTLTTPSAAAATTFTAAGASWLMEIHAGGGTDTLTAGNAGSYLFGEAGTDTLISGNGSDQMLGGADFDTFRFADGGGTDYVWDWQDGTDRIDLSLVAGIDDFTDLTINIAYAASNWYGYGYGSGTVWVQTGGTGALDAGDFFY
ncbi:MAG: tandem-95 repeat protein [Phyllobacteriaceae bacterium]|nr:tandem-95 repeat protein [Phyllobacteriaceae bacterium]